LDCTLSKILFHKDVLDDVIFGVIICVFDQFNEFFTRQLPLGSLDFWGRQYTFGLAETALVF